LRKRSEIRPGRTRFLEAFRPRNEQNLLDIAMLASSGPRNADACERRTEKIDLAEHNKTTVDWAAICIISEFRIS